LRQEVRLDCESPLSAKEQEMFHELCVIPGEEEEKMKVEEEVCIEEKREGIPKSVGMENGDVEPVLSSLKLLQASGQQGLSRLSHSLLEVGEESGAESSSNMIPIAGRTKSTRNATVSKVNEKQEQEQKKPQVLRRSKRVAAAQMQQERKKSQMRKRLGSRDGMS